MIGEQILRVLAKKFPATFQIYLLDQCPKIAKEISIPETQLRDYLERIWKKARREDEMETQKQIKKLLEAEEYYYYTKFFT